METVVGKSEGGEKVGNTLMRRKLSPRLDWLRQGPEIFVVQGQNIPDVSLYQV